MGRPFKSPPSVRSCVRPSHISSLNMFNTATPTNSKFGVYILLVNYKTNLDCKPARKFYYGRPGRHLEVGLSNQYADIRTHSPILPI